MIDSDKHFTKLSYRHGYLIKEIEISIHFFENIISINDQKTKKVTIHPFLNNNGLSFAEFNFMKL